MDAMKRWVVAAAVLALLPGVLALPAQAQMGGKRSRGGDTKSEEKKPQVDDKAYKAALERIPEPKEKYDPWGAARPAEPDKQKKK
jgi:hypothetical protein